MTSIMLMQLAAAGLCGWVALCAFTLHIISSPRRRPWMNVPGYVRRGFLLTGGLFTWRSVNFVSLADQSQALGQINAEGVLGLVGLAYLLTTLAWWAMAERLPGRWWERLDWLRREARIRGAEVAPVLLDSHEIAEVARATGVPTAEPGEGPEAVVREGMRRGRKTL